MRLGFHARGCSWCMILGCRLPATSGACASDCEYGGTCDLMTSMCMCAAGYTGATCGTGACAVDSDCEYRGTCDLTTLMCMCAAGYTGTTCGTGACAVDSDCEYGGTCDLTTLMCMCAAGYTGTTCETGFASPFDHQIKYTV
eukprot:XP_011665812.1 PREDICTED: multiple epidermal growth factor-like domains protein 11 [Strongylocentrotus purpuratus]